MKALELKVHTDLKVAELTFKMEQIVQTQVLARIQDSKATTMEAEVPKIWQLRKKFQERVTIQARKSRTEVEYLMCRLNKSCRVKTVSA